MASAHYSVVVSRQQNPIMIVARHLCESAVAFRYLLVSGLVMVGHQAILFFTNTIMGWSGGWANIFAATVLTIPSYVANRSWVWAVEGAHSIARHFAPFWTLVIAGLLASTAGSAFAQHRFGAGLMVNVASLAAYTVVWAAKFLILGRIFRPEVVVGA